MFRFKLNTGTVNKKGVFKMTTSGLTLGQEAISILAYMLLMFPNIDNYPEGLIIRTDLFLRSLSRSKGMHDDDIAVFYSKIKSELEKVSYMETEEYVRELEKILEDVFACPRNVKEKIMEIARDVRSRW